MPLHSISRVLQELDQNCVNDMLQVRKERMTLDMQTLRMERELARYGETLACANHACATAGQGSEEQYLICLPPPMRGAYAVAIQTPWKLHDQHRHPQFHIKGGTCACA